MSRTRAHDGTATDVEPPAPAAAGRVWPAWILALASSLAVLVSNISGLAVGDDGVGYRAIADSLTAGRGFGYFLEDPVTIWPPGWPTLMSITDRVAPGDAVTAAVLLNALTAFGVVLATSRLAQRLVPDRFIANLITAVAALGASSVLFGHLLMTDFAFVGVMLGLFLALSAAAERPGLGAVVASATIVWAAFMTRYAGLVLIATGALWLALDTRRTIRDRMIRGTTFALVASLVPIAWIARNRSVDGTSLGVRYSSARGLVGNALDVVATIGNFVLPGIAIESRTLWAAVAVLGIGAVTVFAAAALRQRGHLGPRSWPGLVRTTPGLLVLHVAVYGAYMLYARTSTGLNRLDFRLLNPLYLPLVLLGGIAIARLRTDAATSAALRRAANVAATGWATLNIVVGLAMVGYFSTAPDLFVGNYARDEFDAVRSSPVLDTVADRCPGDPDAVGSNLPNALYPVVESTWSPRLTGLESNDPVDDLDRLAADLAAGRERCLIWIDLEPTYGHLADLDELRRVAELELVERGDRVSLYRLTAKR